MLPKITAHEDLPKPHRKVSRLKTIGHQIRYHYCYCCFMIHVPYSVPHNLPWKEEFRGKGDRLVEKMGVDAWMCSYDKCSVGWQGSGMETEEVLEERVWKRASSNKIKGL